MSPSGLKFALFTVILAFNAIDNSNCRVIYVSTAEDKKEKIVGAEDTCIFRHPYQVLLKNDDYICGGTILTESYILTAAHCVHGIEGNTVITGASKTFFDGPGIAIEEKWIHHKYSSEPVANDIAVIKLSRPIKFDKSRQPAQLPTKNVEIGEVAYVTGYGAKHASTEQPSTGLRVAKVQVWNHKRCKLMTQNKVSDYEICVLSPHGTGVCVGDSGGPLVINNTIVGVISYGFGGCANGWPQVFSNVYKYLPFINKIIKKSSDR